MVDWAQQIKEQRQFLGYSRKKMSEIIGISEGSLRSYETSIREPNYKTYLKITEYFKNAKGEKMEYEAYNRKNEQKLIDLQQEKIALQAEKIEQLKQNTYPVQSNAFANIACHFESMVEVKLVPLKRRVTEVNLEPLSKALGIDVSPYFSLNDWHPFKDHPLTDIIHMSTQKELDRMIDTLPTIYNSLKTLMSEHYIKVPVIYIANDRKVYTMCHCKINWANPIVIHTKTEFMNGDV
tara:strand:- start:153 stop:863 length:711 start_codon:yes stop_codon:yes gene_type:complete